MASWDANPCPVQNRLQFWPRYKSQPMPLSTAEKVLQMLLSRNGAGMTCSANIFRVSCGFVAFAVHPRYGVASSRSIILDRDVQPTLSSGQGSFGENNGKKKVVICRRRIAHVDGRLSAGQQTGSSLFHMGILTVVLNIE